MNVKEKVLREIRKSAQDAKKKAQENFDAAMKNAEFKKLYLQMRALNFDISKLDFEGKNCQEKKRELKRVSILAKEALNKIGMEFDDFEPEYACKKCKDSGFYGKNLCDCYHLKMQKELVNNLGNRVNPKHTFEKADFDLFEEKEKVKSTYEKIENWCEKMETSEYKNLVLSGPTGVGKTYLVECVSNRLMQKDRSVVFYSAFSLNNLFLKFHTTFDESKAGMLDGVLECEVLIVDDLGSEPKFKNVSEEYFYLLLNERLSRDKSTIVTTNLLPDEILNRYSERVFSRLCNKRNTVLLKMEGSDLRLKRKEKN